MSKDEAITLPRKCTFTRTSMTIADSVTEREWEEIGETLSKMQGAITFWIGDWVRFGEAKKYISSDKYDQAESVTGLERKTLQNAAYLSESISSSRRREELTPAHHAEVAALVPKDQDRWLERAIKEKMTVKDFRAAIQGSTKQMVEPRARTIELVKGKLQSILAPYENWKEFAKVLKEVNEL